MGRTVRAILDRAGQRDARFAVSSALLVAGLLSQAACPQPSAVQGATRKQSSTFNIAALSLPNLVSVDWDFQFWFLDAVPAEMYNDYQQTSTRAGGQITAVLPCLTGASGTGNNQVQAKASLWFAGATAPVIGTGSTIFVCSRSLDTPVDLIISIQVPVNAGFGDVGAKAVGVSCTSSIAWKDDSWLAVCSDSSCGDADSVFLFQNTCEQLGGGAPAFWTCGASADWTVLDVPSPLGADATSQFAVPPGDGAWQFGVSALPVVVLAAPDPTLTDAAGRLEVFSNVTTPLASLARAGGVNSASLDSTRVAAFAADLLLAADAPGGATPHQLLVVRIGPAGSSAAVWEPFGPCDSAVQGAQEWPGLFAIDARLAGPAAVKVFLATSPGGLATQSALCTAVRANDGTPLVACSAAGPLS